MARPVRKPKLKRNLKSRLFNIFWVDIYTIHTFRVGRGRQHELHEAEGVVHELPDDEGVVEVLDDDEAKVEKLNVRKKKKGNNK